MDSSFGINHDQIDNDLNESNLDIDNSQIDLESNSEFDNYEDISEFSQAEQFIYDAELTNTFLEEGDLNVNDLAEAEQIANNYSSLSDNAFTAEDSYNINTDAGEIIKEAILEETYLENGYIDVEDMIQAERQAVMQGIQEDSVLQDTHDGDLTDGGEFIQEALLKDIYLEDGSFEEDLVNESTEIAYDSDDIDDLLD